ncbi:MAG: hypothetical protein FWD31_10295 [Planctomycetaceae bacterium]|nr:hypothetical protein [Planctomycetaceae bacterium]
MPSGTLQNEKSEPRLQQLHRGMSKEGGLQRHIARVTTKSFFRTKETTVAAFERLDYVVQLKQCSLPAGKKEGQSLQDYCNEIKDMEEDSEVWQQMADFYGRLGQEKVNSVFLAADITLDDLNLPRNNKLEEILKSDHADKVPMAGLLASNNGMNPEDIKQINRGIASFMWPSIILRAFFRVKSLENS